MGGRVGREGRAHGQRCGRELVSLVGLDVSDVWHYLAFG